MIRLQKILVPVDFSENSLKAVHYGLEIARDRKAKLYFLHVINQRIIDTIHEMSVKGYKGDFIEALKSLVRDREKDFREFIPQNWYEGLDTKLMIRKGKPADEVIRFAREEGIDLIIVGTQGRSALEVAFLGSVARSVVNHAGCPVLVVRPVEHDFVK